MDFILWFGVASPAICMPPSQFRLSAARFSGVCVGPLSPPPLVLPKDGESKEENLKYGVNGRPSLPKAIPLALQHVFSAFAGTMSGGILMAQGMGMNTEQTALVVQCAMLICGIATIIQSVGIGPVGARLPIVTGGSYTFIAPMIALAANPRHWDSRRVRRSPGRQYFADFLGPTGH